MTAVQQAQARLSTDFPALYQTSSVNGAQVLHMKQAEPEAWIGRTIFLAVSDAADCIHHVAIQVFIKIPALIQTDLNALGQTLRKSEKHILKLVEYVTSSPGYFNKLRAAIKIPFGFIDFAQVVGDIKYFATENLSEKRFLELASRVVLLPTSFGGALLFLNEKKLIDLGKIATAIGEARIFGFVPDVVSYIPVLKDISGLQDIAKSIGDCQVFSIVPKIPLGTVVTVCLMGFYALGSMDAFNKYFEPGNEAQHTQAALTCAYFVSEIALEALVVSGVVGTVGLGLMASASLSLCIAKLVHSVYHKKELEILPSAQAPIKATPVAN